MTMLHKSQWCIVSGIRWWQWTGKKGIKVDSEGDVGLVDAGTERWRVEH